MLTSENVCPLGLLVPMELSDHALLQSHVHAGNFGRCTELSHGRLSSPTAIFNSNV
jgi:hypothetical protein